MEYLQSFSLRDFLIFSPESYFTLFELSNRALWPFQIPLVLFAIFALVLLYKRHTWAARFTLLWLSLVWGFVGYWYFAQYYIQISTYAHFLSYAFWLEAGLLFVFAVFLPKSTTPIRTWRWIMGNALITYGVLIHPVVSALIWGQSWLRLELFSVAPDPTAIASLGFILLLPMRANWLLLPIPVLWLLVSFVTYQAF